MGIELFDVRDTARVEDGVCVGAERRDPEIDNVEDTFPLSREEDGRIIGEKFKSENVDGSVLWLGVV